MRRAAILCLLLLAGCGASVDGNIGAGDLASVAEPASPVPQGGYRGEDHAGDIARSYADAVDDRIDSAGR